jgi:signal transduction histidine kinase
MFFLQEGFTYRNFLLDVLAIFFFVAWFWLLITVASDLFRRHDASSWVKASWVIGFIIFPFLFVLLYLIFQGTGMAERNAQQARRARDELRSLVGFSVADEIEKLGRRNRQGRSAMPNLHDFALGLCSNEVSSAPTRHARDRCKHDGASRRVEGYVKHARLAGDGRCFGKRGRPNGQGYMMLG